MVQTNILGDLVRNKAQVLQQLRAEKERERLMQQQMIQQFAQQIGGVIQAKQKADVEKQKMESEQKWKTEERTRKWGIEDQDREAGILEKKMAEADKQGERMSQARKDMIQAYLEDADLGRKLETMPDGMRPDEFERINFRAERASKKQAYEDTMADIERRLKSGAISAQEANTEFTRARAGEVGKPAPQTAAQARIDELEGNLLEAKIDEVMYRLANPGMTDEEKMQKQHDFALFLEKEKARLKADAAQGDGSLPMDKIDDAFCALAGLLGRTVEKGIGEAELVLPKDSDERKLFLDLLSRWSARVRDTLPSFNPK